MLYEDINWGRLIKDTPVEELEEINESFQECWRENYGDTSGLVPPDRQTRQGGGDGLYIANPKQQKTFANIRKKIVKLNLENNGKIKSEPLDPSGDDTNILSVAPYYIIRDVPSFLRFVSQTDSVSFTQTRSGKIHFLVWTGTLFRKVETEEQIKHKQQAIEEWGGLFDKQIDCDEYEPLDDASLELIFFNDTGLEFDPSLYNMDKVRGIAAVKNYFDFITDIDYENDEDPEAGCGGVKRIVYNEAQNVARVDCFIDGFCISNKPPFINNNANEIVPILNIVDHMIVAPAFNNEEQTFIWLSFAVRNIRRS